MRMVDLIIKKRNGEVLTDEEIHFIINGYVNGYIPDYQMSAFLMSVYFRGMNEHEQLALTMEMLHSGETVDLSMIEGVKCDKHSTGGVGDKTSLVVIPLASSFGIKMAKMSGRGLGHTGGTLDKLESIPGFRIEQSAEHFIEQVKKIGLAVIGQTANITPADKLMYALRDVTGTIESIPLIASSIMSKKIASGADNIVLDVKVGDGAFMKDVESAEKLSHAMVKIGKLAGRNTVATLTQMNEPLGCAVGNALEVMEAIDTLRGGGPEDFRELCISFVNEMLLISHLAKNEEEARKMTLKAMQDGKGIEKLKEMIIWQGGNPHVVDDYSLFNLSKETKEVIYNGPKAYVSSLKALPIGEAAMLLGAGRERKEDKIDYGVGIVLNKKVGDVINPSEALATIYSRGKNVDEAYQTILNAYSFSLNKVDKLPKIIETIR